MTDQGRRPVDEGRRPNDEGRVLAIRGLSKSYAVPVLSDVDLDLAAGEVHALMGANGAGKSTLVRIVCGLTRPDSGVMTMGGQPHAPASRRDAEAAGVRVVLQELNLVDTLTVAENLGLARLPHRFGVIDRAKLNDDAARALASVGLNHLDPRAPVSALGIGERQLVEIASALARDCRLLVLDEPTAALTRRESERLFEHVRRLCARGIAVLYVTHRMEEVHRITDRVTVLRDGRVVDRRDASDLDHATLVTLVTGGTPLPPPPTVDQTDVTQPIALRVERLCRGASVRDVSFDVHRGETVGLFGLVGSGRTEVLRAIYGADVPHAGRISVAGGRVVRPGSPRHAVAAGIGMVPEDRQGHALLAGLSIRSNVSLVTVSRLAHARTWLDSRREADAVSAVTSRLDVRMRGQDQPVRELSGGNQQKIVLARWLLRDVDVLLVDEPTRGIDVGAKQAIHRLLGELVQRGTAVVIVSSELEELTSLCDRIVVIGAGRVTATFARPQFSEPALVAAAFAGASPS
jgi:ribose transport system ATP-binding protein